MVATNDKPKLTIEDISLWGRKREIHKRCFLLNANGELDNVNESYIHNIFNSKRSHVPSLAVARQISKALTDILGRDITTDDLYDYLEKELGKLCSTTGASLRKMWNYMEFYPSL